MIDLNDIYDALNHYSGQSNTGKFCPCLQESIEHDSDTDSELEEISIDEPSAHAPRWVTAITVLVRKELLMGTPRPVVMAEHFNVRAMEIKKYLVRISSGKLEIET